MRWDRVLRILFVIYCAEAGALMLVVPWSSAWDRLLFQLPWFTLRDVALGALPRSLVAGFGTLHLVWGAQDLLDWVTRRSR